MKVTVRHLQSIELIGTELSFKLAKATLLIVQERPVMQGPHVTPGLQRWSLCVPEGLPHAIFMIDQTFTLRSACFTGRCYAFDAFVLRELGT